MEMKAAKYAHTLEKGVSMNKDKIKEITKETVKKSFFNFFICKEDVKTQHLLLYKLFPQECNTRSVMGGLETSLGITLWERIASRLAKENGYQILDNKVEMQPEKMPVAVTNLIAKYKDKREEANANMPMREYVSELNKVINNLNSSEIPKKYKKLTKGSGIDIYIKKNNIEYAFDIKTVQINAGSGTKYNEVLMKWIAFNALYQKFKGTNYSFNAHLIIPYDPHTESNWWTEFGERAYPLDKKDLMLGDEFWNLLSGEKNTLELITSAFDELKAEGFESIYVDFFHNSSLQNNIKLIEHALNVKYLSGSTPEKITSKLYWECNKCKAKFTASIKWFSDQRICAKCRTSLSN